MLHGLAKLTTETQMQWKCFNKLWRDTNRSNHKWYKLEVNTGGVGSWCRCNLRILVIFTEVVMKSFTPHRPAKPSDQEMLLWPVSWAGWPSWRGSAPSWCSGWRTGSDPAPWTPGPGQTEATAADPHRSESWGRQAAQSGRQCHSVSYIDLFIFIARLKDADHT